jgi:hypothetical protein
MQTIPDFYLKFTLILFGLLAFGFGYNLLTQWLERTGTCART